MKTISNMEKIYYKVVKKNLTSAVVKGKGQVKYKVGEWVHAPQWLRGKGYHLCIFDNPINAMYYAETFGAEIWTCVTKGVKKPPLFCDLSSLEKGILEITNDSWIDGTLMAEEVKLIKKIELEE